MASLLDSPMNFFTKASPEQFNFVLSQYREIFKVHAQETRSAKKNGPAELIKLDNWYQDTLPQLIKSRKDQQLLYDEIVQITKWKLLRGKFRPSILDLVRTNTETAIKNVTKKAFKKMPNISAAITALTQLKGIAPATASAILVAHSPHVCPYMSEENMANTPGVEESDLSISEYLNYVDQTNLCVERLKALDPKADWITPHNIELAIWTYCQAKQYNSNLLDKMPVPNGKQIINNDEDSNGKLDAEEDDENRIIDNDEGVNSEQSESDESSNQSIEQQSNGQDSQLNGQNGLHLNGNLNGDESNLSTPVSSENEDKSNDSLLNNKDDENSNITNSLVTNSNILEPIEQTTNDKIESTNEDDKMEVQVTSSESVINQNKLESIDNAFIPDLSEQLNKNQSEAETISNNLDENNLNNETELNVNEKLGELNNHLNNQVTSNHKSEELNNVKLNNLDNNIEISHCNGALKNGINMFNNADSCSKDALISSSEDNSNNILSEENSNLSSSNLSYTDLHSTDNAIDDGPAYKRIRVE